MAVGCSVRTSHGAFRGRGLRLAREWEAALSSRGKPLVERSPPRKCVHPACCLSGLPDRLSALFSPGAMPGERRPKGIGHVASVLSAVSCPRLPPLSESLSCSDRCGGWMWQAGPCGAPGRPTGSGNMLRCFHWLKPSRRQNLLLVHLVPSGRTIAGAGTTGSRATPGSDHHNCASPSLEFPLVWL